MTKLKPYLAAFLALSQICTLPAFAVSYEETNTQTSTYSVTIPESISFGELYEDADNHMAYEISVSYQSDSPELYVTSDEKGVLTSENHSLSFENNMPLAVFNAENTTATGLLSIDAVEVAKAPVGDYVGSLQFTITKASPSLTLSAYSLALLQGESQEIAMSLGSADGYSFSVSSSDASLATGTISGNRITVTTKSTNNTENKEVILTVSATKSGETVSKTISLLVYGAKAAPVEVTPPTVDATTGSASVVITGDAILTSGLTEEIIVTDSEITFDATSTSEDIKEVEVSLGLDTLEAITERDLVLTIETNVGTMSFDTDALAQILGETDSSATPLVLQMKKIETISLFSASTDSIDFSNLYELSLSLDGTPISFAPGSVAVTIPCDETILWAYHVVDGELVEQLPVTVSDGMGTFYTTHLSTWLLSSVDYFASDDSTETPGGTTTPDPDTGYFLADGYYYVDLWLWHQYANQVSMGDVAFENNRQALVTVSGSKATKVEIATNPVNISGIESAVQYLEVEGVDVGYLEREIFTTSTNSRTFYYITRASFTMPTKGQPSSFEDATYLDVRLAVPDTPMDLVADEDGCMSARFKFDWATAEKTSNSSLNQNESMSSGSITSTDSQSETEDVATTETLTVETKVDSSGTAQVTLDADELEKSIASILESKESSDASDGQTMLSLEVSYSGDALSLVTNIPEESFASIATQIDYLKLTSPLGTMVLDSATMEGITAQHTGTITITMTLGEISETAISDEKVMALIGDRTIMDFSITCDDEYISEFAGSITVSIPYTLGTGENSTKLSVYHIAEDGSTKEILGAYYYLGAVHFKTTHFSTFALAYDENKLLYSDVPSDSWYYDAVAYVTEQGLLTGTASYTFSPNTFMSRAMMVTALYRMAGEPEVRGSSRFSDVLPQQWYTDAVIWATQNQIVTGYEDGTFGANDSLSREEMVLMLYRYAAKSGATLTSEMSGLESFDDKDAVSNWAVYAMAWAVEEGILSGVTETSLSPYGTATRAQVAMMLMHFGQI